MTTEPAVAAMAMGICTEGRRRRQLATDMFHLGWFAFLMLFHSHEGVAEAAAAAGAGGHRSIRIDDGRASTSTDSKYRSSSIGTLHGRMDLQMQISDNKDISISTYPRHLQAEDEAVAGSTLPHDLHHNPQPSEASNRKGTEISTHASADSGEKHKDSVDVFDSQGQKLETKEVGVSKRMNLQFSTPPIRFNQESVHHDLVDSKMLHLQNHGHTKRMDLDLPASDSSQKMQMKSDHDHQMQALHGGLCMYTITTETGKKWGAGTDSTISLALYNQDEDRAYFPDLDNGKNNFEKGHTDTFSELGPCVENICKMILSSDNSGLFSGWYVDTVGFSVTTPEIGHQEKTWELHQWLPSDDAAASLFVLKDDCSYAFVPTPSLPP